MLESKIITAALITLTLGAAAPAVAAVPTTDTAVPPAVEENDDGLLEDLLGTEDDGLLGGILDTDDDRLRREPGAQPQATTHGHHGNRVGVNLEDIDDVSVDADLDLDNLERLDVDLGLGL